MFDPLTVKLQGCLQDVCLVQQPYNEKLPWPQRILQIFEMSVATRSDQ